MDSTNPDHEAEAEVHADNLLQTSISLKEKVKDKARKIMHLPEDPAQREFSQQEIFADPAFNPSQVLDQKSPPKPDRTSRESVSDGLKDFKYLVAHPRQVMRSKATRVAAEKIGSARHPFQAQDHDRELIDAHDTLAHVATNIDPGSGVGKDQVDDACDRVAEVESQRESVQTAWILGRHVNRVKAIHPIPRPEQSDHTTIENGESRLQWEKYLGRLALFHTQGFTSHYVDDFESAPFDLEDLARIIERLAITSAPWQAFLMEVRNVYTWKDPKCTAKWAVLFWSLWYTEHIGAYFWFWIIYSTVRSKFQPTSVERIRDSVTRAFDRGSKVQAWGELLQQHGKQDWIEPLLDDMGPLIQRQLGDLADFLEVLINFHRHERPNKTMASLFFFLSCLAVALFADMAFCVKLVWFILGGGFFVSFPIASRYPKYRLLVSHWRLMFWDIPTHAELAILQLQEKAVIRDANFMEFELREPDESAQDYTTNDEAHKFLVHHDMEGKGELEISRSGIEYSSNVAVQFWGFSSLSEMRKSSDLETEKTLHNLRKLGSRSGEILHFIFSTSELKLLLHPADRNRAFNLVLAWSGLKWQSLQMERRRGGRDNLDTAIKRAFQ
ncbi:hypothetical protein LTR84_004128 [Exophiala bonariae]|uniref:Uncharacterized protein n=1 Tax=Exophiala bonariae TaxID=1690606 RepID=A0AAV9N9I1_9EURO|nr:hypothetical protein LTR84_004128 [Exophiala bonariae]